jgi:hypothetical protein
VGIIVTAIGEFAAVAAFDTGGYTGPGHPKTPAGVVHKNEHVATSDAVNHYGVGLLDGVKDRSVHSIRKGDTATAARQFLGLQVERNTVEFHRAIRAPQNPKVSAAAVARGGQYLHGLTARAMGRQASAAYTVAAMQAGTGGAGVAATMGQSAGAVATAARSAQSAAEAA